MSAGVERVVNGDVLRLTPEYAHAEPLRSEWEPALYARFKAALRLGMTVLDVGASFGLYAVAAGRAVADSGRVYAFEPAPVTARALRLHLQYNDVAERVEVVEAAAADRSGSRTFWSQETSFPASLDEGTARREVGRYDRPVEGRRVRALTLDDFCADRRLEPAVVKIDVEGAEAAVLRGARGLLARRHALLFLEVHGVGPHAQPPPSVRDELRGWEWSRLGSGPDTAHYACRPARGR